MMNGDGEMPNEKMESPKEMSGDICVPSASLEVEGEDGKAIQPAVGDEVEVTVKGTVSKTEGGEIYVKPSSFNDVPVGSVSEQKDEGMKPGDKKLEDASDEELRGAYRAMVGNGQDQNDE